ncbi:MAG: D-alanyl-D-alanine carboxypeptidase [Ruminococcus sp.]|nr:D-alanyl-D-alanine carboxypeptidase [Ruminococcus sp.]
MSKKKHGMNKTAAGFLITAVLLLASGAVAYNWVRNSEVVPASAEVNLEISDVQEENTEEITEEIPTEPEIILTDFRYPVKTEGSKEFDIDTEYPPRNVVLMDADTGGIIAYKANDEKMFPASLTKVMTLIITVENTENFKDTVEMTSEMIEPLFADDASLAGFPAGDKPTIEEILYGIVLPSGADATVAAAKYVAGSEKAFVRLMNEKAEQMGLKNTHFMNTSGLHDEKHYSTANDMAAILSYAYNNEICRKVLSTAEYTIPTNNVREEEIYLQATLFKRMYGDEMPNVLVRGGKTGYTDEAMHCVEAFADVNGKTYIGVVCGSTSSWSSTGDLLSLFSVYCADGEPYDETVNVHIENEETEEEITEEFTEEITEEITGESAEENTEE